MYIVRTYYSYAVCIKGRTIMEFASYDEAYEFIKSQKGEK